MAITIVEHTEYVTTDNLSVYTTTGTYTPTANKSCVAFCFATGSAQANPVGSGNGSTWTRAVQQQVSTTNTNAVYWVTFGASPTTTGFSYDVTGDAGTGAGIWVAQLDGVDTTAPIKQSKAAAGTTSAPTWTFDAATDSDSAIIVGFQTFVSNPAACDGPTGLGYTEAMDSGWASPTSGVAIYFHASPGAVTTVTVATTYANWRGLAVEIDASSVVNATASPSTVAAVAGISAAGQGTGVASPGTVAGVAGVSASAVGTGGDGLASPDTVPAVAGISASGVGTATASPSTVAAVSGISASGAGSGIASPGSVDALAAVPQVVAQGAAVGSVGPVAAVAAVPQVVGSGNATASPATVAAVASIPQVIASGVTEVIRIIYKFARWVPSLFKRARHDPSVSKFARHDPSISRYARHDPSVSKAARHDPSISKRARGTE